LIGRLKGILTEMMRMQRKMPATVTKAPPEKSKMRPAFLRGLNEDCHSIGIGMLIR
jgi:hypothetical protein